MKKPYALILLLLFPLTSAIAIEGQSYKTSMTEKKDTESSFKKVTLDSDIDIFLTELMGKKINEKNILEMKKFIPKSCHDKDPESELNIRYECKNSQIKKINLGIEDYSGKIVGDIILNVEVYDGVLKRISEILKKPGKKNSKSIDWSHFGSKNHNILLSRDKNAQIKFVYYISTYPG
jgi:hypothetical protein